MKRIFKRLTALITGCTVLISGHAWAFAAEFGCVNCDLLNVRVSPNTECEVIDRLYEGTTFDIVYTDNGWYNIRMNNGVTGFVSADYVTRVGDIAGGVNPVGHQIASDAHKYLGYSYVYGTAGPNTFDCSGFSSYLYKQYGYSIPRTSFDQSSFGTYVSKENLMAGDLVFFSNRSDRRVNHVGIYVGNNEFIHASTSKRGVVKDSLTSNYYINHYISASRVL